MPDFIVAKIACNKMVRIDGPLGGPANQPLPVTPGEHVVALDCTCGYTPKSATVTGGPLEAPGVVEFTCAKAAE